MDHVRGNVDGGFSPGNKLPIVPNLIVVIHCHKLYSRLPSEV